MKQKMKLFLLTIPLIMLLVIFGREKDIDKSVVINEVRSWDVDITRNGYYGSDYIELYNVTSEEISLDGWYMSDDENDLTKSRLENITIEAKDFVLIYANEKGDSGDSVLFKINPAGEKIFLSDPAGNVVDSIYVPEQELGTVYARVTDGADEWAVKESSILASNDETQILPVRTLSEPIFSHESGFYEEEFELSLSAEPGEIIYYTLDGSIPTKDSNVYEDGIVIKNTSSEPNVINAVRNIREDWQTYGPDETPVDKAIIVRAISMDEENHASEVVTKTYFVGLDQYKDGNVLSVVSDYEELFGDEGIFVTGKKYDEAYSSGTLDDSIVPNFFRSGRRWEVQGNIQLLTAGEEIINQKIGIRIQGASSRLGKKKRMGIFAREEYSGSQYLEGLDLDGKQAHSCVICSEKENAILQDLVKDRDIATQSAIENTVFLNGEYYYSGYLLEKYNKYYLQDHYGVNPENVMLVKDKEATEGPELSREYYDQMVRYVEETDLSIQANYEELLTKMDMQSFIDYICANAYFCNMDVSETKNYMVWRTIEPEDTEAGDTRWRWMLYDVDCISWNHPEDYGVERKAQINSFAEIMETTGKALDSHTIFGAAKANEGFCKQFVLTFMDMVNVNFSIENVEKIFEKWNVTIEEYDGFFKERFDYIVPYMAEEFGLTGTLEEVTLKINDTEGGNIQLNTTSPDLTDGSWTGKYYTDYPVTATAIPEEGYQFVGWSGSVTSDSATIEAEVTVGGITLEAVFEKIGN